MRAFCVVIDPPAFDDLARLTDAGEPVLVQAFIPETAIETLDVRILGRFARIDEIQLDAVIIGPSIQRSQSNASSASEIWRGPGRGLRICGS